MFRLENVTVAVAMATGGDDNYVAMAMGMIIKYANRLKTKCWNTQSLVRQGAGVHVCGFSLNAWWPSLIPKLCPQ